MLFGNVSLTSNYSERDVPKGLTTEIISKPFGCQPKGFLHFNQDCTRAITQHR